MEVVSGKSKHSELVPDLAKASPEQLSSISERLANAEDSGRLSEIESAMARNIISKSSACKAGHVQASVVADLIAKAPINVRSLFTESVAA